MFIVTIVHALVMLLWRVRSNKVDKACLHWRPPLQTHSAGNCPLLHFGSPVGEGIVGIHSQGQERQTCSEAVTHVLLLWTMRSKLDGNESDVRLVVVIATFLCQSNASVASGTTCSVC
jgi:hypothetical protein